MPSLKEYQDKIKSLKNTAKVTKTMKMVSTSKFRKAQEAQANSRLYAESLDKTISRLASSADGSHPLVQSKEEAKTALVVLFASDKGLCGGFNNNLFKFIDKWYAENASQYDSVDFIACGKRSSLHLKKVKTPLQEIETNFVEFATAKDLGDKLQEQFIDGTYDEIFLSYSKFISALSQKPQIEKLLPMSSTEEEGAEEELIDYIYEPSQEELLTYLLPKTVNFKVFNAFLENAAGEHAARMTAMENATTNANKLISETTILRNRARQAAITTELTEIVAGAESLK